MAENTAIEWCDHTFNTHWGCSAISRGCKNCYAEMLAKRFGYSWGDDAPKREFPESHWNQLLRWNKRPFFECAECSNECSWRGECNGESCPACGGHVVPARRRVFTNSMSDLFDKFAPDGVRERHFSYVERTSNLDHLLLTKRIGNVRKMVPARWLEPGGWPANAFLGISVVDQEEADRDIPKLLALPALVRFLSMEPLLGPVDLRFHFFSEPTGNWRTKSGKRQMELRKPADGGIHWVIVGGESGRGQDIRPMHPQWARDLRDQCAAAGVPFLFKQHGEWREPLEGEAFDTSMGGAAKPPAFIVSKTDGTVNCFRSSHIVDGQAVVRVGKKAAGRLLDGRTHDGFPRSST